MDEAIPPRSPESWFRSLLELAQRIWSRRGDVRAACGSLHSLAYWTWLLEVAWFEDRELRALLPTPPRGLISRVRGDATAEEFHASGVSEAAEIHRRLEEAGFDFARPGRLLDFGCGSGRLLRVFSRFSDTVELHGADVDADAIAWCREHLPFARYETLAVRPPSPFPDAAFDAVYAFSVFSHLPEELHLAWLAELGRITAEGAVVLLTTQGRRCAERFASGDAFGLTIPSRERMRADLPRLGREGFLYYPYPRPTPSLPAESRGEDVQGMTFVTEPYVRRRWLEHFELVALHEAPQDWQDHVVLRRRRTLG